MRKYITTSKIQKPSELPREKKRVFDSLVELFDNWQINCISELSDDILVTGTKCFTEFPVSMDSIPSGNGWVWRQSNARVSVRLDFQTIVTIVKLNTKKTVNAEKTKPPYKFWIVEIQLPNQCHLWYLYCEKGLNESSQPPVQEFLFPNFSETELSFLDMLCLPQEEITCWSDIGSIPPFLM